jgi:hypothetical protein
MTDLSDLKTDFRILMDKLKKKKNIDKTTEELCWLFFLEGYKSDKGETNLIST